MLLWRWYLSSKHELWIYSQLIFKKLNVKARKNPTYPTSGLNIGFCIYRCALSFYFLSASVPVANLCKQFGPRSGQTNRRALFGSKMSDTLLVFGFLKYVFEKERNLNNHQTSQSHAKLPFMQIGHPFEPSVLFVGRRQTVETQNAASDQSLHCMLTEGSIEI